MHTSLLLSLPPELRLTIYEHALTYPKALEFYYRPINPLSHGAGLPLAPAANNGNLIGVTQICRLIRHECDKPFYRLNTFTIHIPQFYDLLQQDVGIQRSSVSVMQSAVGRVGSAIAAVVPALTIDLGDLRINEALLTARRAAAAAPRTVVAEALSPVRTFFAHLQACTHDFPRLDFRLKVRLGSRKYQVSAEPFKLLPVEVNMRDVLVGVKEARTRFEKGRREGEWMGCWVEHEDMVGAVLRDWNMYFIGEGGEQG